MRAALEASGLDHGPISVHDKMHAMGLPAVPSTASLSRIFREELQTQVDAFDHIYNTERPHQGLPGRVTPQQAWDATPKAAAPRPSVDQTPWFERPVPPRRQHPQPPLPADLPADTRVRKVATSGTIHVDTVTYTVDVDHIFKHVLVVTDGNQPGDKITITDLDGVILAEHTHPDPGVSYVGNIWPPGTRPKAPQVSPKS